MAYLQRPDEDKDKLVTDTGTGAPVAPVTQAQPAAGPARSTAPDSSRNFVNLSSYLQPNQGATQALGNKVAGTVNQATTAANQAISGAQTGVTGLVNDATVNLDQDLLNRTLADPTGADVNQLAKQTSGAYAGPNTARDTGLLADADTAVLKAGQTAGLADTTGGRKELIQQTTGRPTTAGALSLDQYLLQNTAGARDPLNQAVAQAKPLADTYKAAEAALNDQIAQAKQTNLDTATSAKTQLGDAASALQANIDAEVKRQQDEARMWQLNAQTYLSGGQTSDKLPPGLLDKLGLSAQQWDQLASQNQALGADRQDLSNYLRFQKPDDVIKPFNVATADQAARYQALSQLAGSQGGYVSPQSLQTAPQLLNFDAAGAQQQLSNVAQNQQALAQQQAAADQNVKLNEQALRDQKKQANVQTGVAVASTIATIAIAVFCYGEGTMVKLSNGSFKPVEEVKLGDDLFLGGYVLGVGEMLAPEVYSYKGCVCTGNHAVYEDGVWLRVADSRLSTKLEGELVNVFPVACANHLLVTDTHVGCDVTEVDNYDLFTGDQRLEIMNRLTERNKLLDQLSFDEDRAQELAVIWPSAVLTGAH